MPMPERSCQGRLTIVDDSKLYFQSYRRRIILRPNPSLLLPVHTTNWTVLNRVCRQSQGGAQFQHQSKMSDAALKSW